MPQPTVPPETRRGVLSQLPASVCREPIQRAT